MIPSFVRVTTKRVALVLSAYFLCRLLFLIWNWDLYREDSLSDILWAFVAGIRFDISAILITNAILFLLWMAPAPWLNRRAVRLVDLGLFAIINTLCIGVNFVDAEFVKFIKKRSSLDVVMISEDIQRQAISVLSTYWYFCLAVIALGGLLAWITPRFPPLDQGNKGRSIWSAGVWRLGVAGLTVLLVRGGFQFKPLHPMDAYFSTHQEIGLLTLNTPFTLIRSHAHGDVEHANYFATDRDAILRLKEMTDLTRPPLGLARGWNVVVIIIESFGSEYTGVAGPTGKGYTPFFDELSRMPGAFFFKLNFANARRSIEGLPAVLCGLPSIMEAPILTSDFSNNNFDCLPRVLARHGYSTYFLHGAHNGSMHFDSFARIAGFENFVGLNEYPKTNPDDFDHYWGVLDEPMLQYAAATMDKAKKPALISLFTLSSHHPYYIPPKYAGKFPKGNLEIHESIGYADYSLRRFFETARTKPWFNHTIFVVTADHTQKSEYPDEYYTQIGYHRVPLLIYVPGLIEHLPKADPSRITQHIDIQPSVLDLLGIDNSDRLLVGQSVFDNGREGRAYNYTAVGYWYLDPHIALDFRRSGQPTLAFSHKLTFERKPVAAQGPEYESALLNLKAVVHYLSNGLLKNNLYDWRQSLVLKQ